MPDFFRDKQLSPEDHYAAPAYHRTRLNAIMSLSITMENVPAGDKSFFVASGTFPGMKRHLSIMAKAAGFAFEHFRHHHFRLALLHGKRRGMT